MNEGQSSLQNIQLTQDVPCILKTTIGGNTSYVMTGVNNMNMTTDQFGTRIEFPQCPGLVFPSMGIAFDYFEAHKKLRAIAAAGQLADYAAQQARRAGAPSPCGRTWQLKSSLEQANVRPVVHIPKHAYIGPQRSHLESTAEPVSRDTYKASTVIPLSQSSPPQTPPQTLFAESTPHVQEIQAKARIRLSAKGLQSWPFEPQATNGSKRQQPLPSPPGSNQARTLPEDHNSPNTYHDDISSLSSYTSDNEILAQPQSSYSSCSLPSAYSTTALPKTLAKKDKRVLGVSSTAGIDE